MENTARVVGLVPVGRLISKIVADKASLIRPEKNRIDMYKRTKTRLLESNAIDVQHQKRK